jgi:molybdopterin-synthase adenylyltransferase
LKVVNVTTAAQNDPLDRYVRQTRFAPLGEEGQRRLGTAAALVCGCGALGSNVANALVRAGVGKLRIVDRDFVDVTNLHRQVLFDEDDAAAGLPKAVAAAEKLRRINSLVTIEPIVAHVDYANIAALAAGMDVILDGSDNFETRFLLNDAAVSLGVPWIYGGCVGAEGRAMTIVPGMTPCFRCLVDECPLPGSTPTCVTSGVLGPIAALVASIQAIEAIKILSGHREAISRTLTVVDLWQGSVRQIALSPLAPCGRGGGGEGPLTVVCPTCGRREFPWLAGKLGSRTAVLCGRNAVQLSRPTGSVGLDELSARLAGVGRVTRNQFLVKLVVDAYELVIFADGRAIVHGTEDIGKAQAVYAMYVGN